MTRGVESHELEAAALTEIDRCIAFVEACSVGAKASKLTVWDAAIACAVEGLLHWKQMRKG